VRIVDGAFAGRVGTIVELDGEWRTVECKVGT
jgi:transcription antitermination factor NusG